MDNPNTLASKMNPDTRCAH